MTTGVRIYLQAIIDNFSRRILAWRVTENLSCETTRELLIEASTNLSAVEEDPDVVLVTDAGSPELRRRECAPLRLELAHESRRTG